MTPNRSIRSHRKRRRSDRYLSSFALDQGEHARAVNRTAVTRQPHPCRCSRGQRPSVGGSAAPDTSAMSPQQHYRGRCRSPGRCRRAMPERESVGWLRMRLSCSSPSARCPRWSLCSSSKRWTPENSNFAGAGVGQTRICLVPRPAPRSIEKKSTTSFGGRCLPGFRHDQVRGLTLRQPRC